MALVTLPSPITWPGIFGRLAGGPSLGAFATLTSVGHYGAYVGVAAQDMVVSHVGFRAGTAAGSPTIETRIETVDTATGLPSGTLWATNTNGTTGTITSNTYVLQALTASATITKGQVYCVKLSLASGTSQAISSASGMFTGLVPGGSNLPYSVVNTGTPTKSPLQTMLTIALGSNSTTFYNIPACLPITGTTGGAFNNTNSAKRGLRFTVPFNCRIVGMKWLSSNATGDYNAVLFNDAGTELSSSSTAFDGDFTGTDTNTFSVVFFDNAVTATAGTTYRAAIEPSSATNAFVFAFTIPSSNYRGATAGGSNCHYTTFATSSWTDTATDTVPVMDIIIDQIDDGSGSGSVVGVIGG